MGNPKDFAIRTCLPHLIRALQVCNFLYQTLPLIFFACSFAYKKTYNNTILAINSENWDEESKGQYLSLSKVSKVKHFQQMDQSHTCLSVWVHPVSLAFNQNLRDI